MNSIRAFLAEIIDYAGLFPPASLPMGAVVSNYAEYLSGPDSDLLGRLVVPAARLTEFAEAARDFLPRRNGSAPWRLSVLVGDETASDARSILEFNSTHVERSDSGQAVCDSVEMHARQAGDVARAAGYLPGSFRMFFEIEPDGDHAPLIREVALQKAAAKIRTGGVTEAAFPSSARSSLHRGMPSRWCSIQGDCRPASSHPLRLSADVRARKSVRDDVRLSEPVFLRSVHPKGNARGRGEDVARGAIARRIRRKGRRSFLARPRAVKHGYAGDASTFCSVVRLVLLSRAG